jgi:hypothetical protein
MKLTAFRVHKWWAMRTAIVLVITVVADGLTAWFVTRPAVWCVAIAASLPITMAVFVAIPVLLEEERKS